MSSIGQLSTALGMTTLETNIGLARINFDFALYKIQAPSEYQELGGLLSASRRETVEGGTSHVTARKLNALFESILPPIPNIIKAYGLRSSEVARLTKDEHANKTTQHRFFPEHSGIDGTNIWAAATSGDKALAVHLLACMLARLWPPSEATSIWVELVAERKKRLGDSQENLSLPALAAREISISRENLAEWDASARAWLRTADKALMRKQKLLMLIIGNLDIAVNSMSQVYESVLQALIYALNSVENMIQGMPQMVHNGAVLLALSAWHLYPNMFVLGETPKTIHMHDNLLDAAGVLTLGIENSLEKRGEGVYWSLPLAYHRHYGPPIHSSRATGSPSSRITFDQLVLVALGCVLKDCGFAEIDPIRSACFFSALYKYLTKCTDEIGAPGSYADNPTPIAWIQLLASGADHLLASKDSDLESLKRLVAYGRRKSNLLGEVKCPMQPAFGIGRPEIFLSLHDDHESAISSEAEGVFSYASACHPRRWRYSSVYQERTPEEKQDVISQKEIRVSDKYLVWNNPPHGFPYEKNPELLKTARESVNESQTVIESKDGPHKRKRKQKKVETTKRPCLVLQCLFGESDGIALFGPPSHKDHLIFEYDDVLNVLKSQNLKPNSIENYLNSRECFTSDYVEVEDSLATLANASKIYTNLPDATLSIDIASHSLCQQQWTQRTPEGRMIPNLSPDLIEAFACIASFETGPPQISLHGLDQVMALSAGNSIYLSQHFLSDPSEDYSLGEVQRIEGNIGKPGLALLIPPKSPMIKSLGGETWNLINHFDFDGKLENNFDTTSLHMSFTEYEFPVDIGVHGSYQREAYFIETVVSIFDKQSWIADLDVLTAFRSEKLTKLAIGTHRAESACRSRSFIGHLTSDTATRGSQSYVIHGTSIDSWNELLDPPPATCILRAHGNWIGRLSATVLSMQLGYNTFVIPLECKDICWECVNALVGRQQDKSIIILWCLLILYRASRYFS